MPGTSSSCSTLVKRPVASRWSTIRCARTGPIPGRESRSAAVAALRSSGPDGAPPEAPATGGGSPSGPVDLNAATAADLDALPGIGPVLAQRIVDHRDATGRFTSVEQLDDVPGIGPATYAELADLVRV